MEMVRIGKLRGPVLEQWENRWSQPMPRWSATRWVWCPRDRWERIKAFQRPFEDEAVADALRRGEMKLKDVEGMVKAQMMASGRIQGIWEMDLYARKRGQDNDRVRAVLLLGEATYREWSAYEQWIIYPIRVALAWLKTQWAEAMKNTKDQSPDL